MQKECRGIESIDSNAIKLFSKEVKDEIEGGIRKKIKSWSIEKWV